MVLRPDEAANQREIERDRNLRGAVGKGIKTAVGIGSTIAGGGLASRILPFINEYIPTDLAIKGISKVSPKTGEFLKRGMEMGLDPKEGMDFIKKHITPENQSEMKSQSPKEDRNIIQQYSPGLYQYLEGLIKNGATPTEAAVKAKRFLDKKHQDIIKKMEKDHKNPFTSIVESIFGGGQSNVNPDLHEGQQQQSAQQGQQSQGLDPAVAQLLQQGQQILSKFRGNRG